MLDQPNSGGPAVPPDATTQRLVLGLVLFHEDSIATLAEYLLRPVAQIEANVAVLVDAGLVFTDGDVVFASQAARRMGVLWPVRVQEPPAAMRLVEAGVLNLDAPLRAYLPDLRLADDAAARGATMRHLLTHTGGWIGDYFASITRGDDALARMVACLDRLE